MNNLYYCNNVALNIYEKKEHTHKTGYFRCVVAER